MKKTVSPTIQGALKELDRVKNILVEREHEHGSPDENFKAIAQMWGAYLNRNITETDVALMMTLFKIARMGTGNVKCDTLRDLVGYPVIAISMTGSSTTKE